MKALPAVLDAPPRSAAELAREKKLRDDPMAEVHGPLFVTCKRCRSRIKLSPKSFYDPFHWMKHRERCLRKPVGVARAPRRSPKDICTAPLKKSPASSSNGDNATPPPLTPDDDRPPGADVFRGRSSLSPNMDDLEPLPPTKPSRVRELDSAFLDYLHRSQQPPPSKHLPLADRWQTWNWSELRPPTWMASHDRDPAFVADDLEEWDDGHDESPLPISETRYPAPRRNQDAPSLST